MVKVHVKGKPKLDLKKLMRRLKAMDQSKGGEAYVSIGVHSSAEDYEGSGVSVAQVALWNEFGTPNARHPTPERSFLRSTLHEHKPEIDAWRAEAINNMLHKGWSEHKALEMIGLRVQVLVQNKIKSNIGPPNADGTLYGMYGKPGKIELGQGTNTLMATQHLLQSITYQVHVGGEAEGGSGHGDGEGHGE